MYFLVYAVVGVTCVLTVSLAFAASPVPSSVMPGHERDRFTESPVERFMQPGPYHLPQVIEPACPARKPPHSKSRSASRKSC